MAQARVCDFTGWPAAHAYVLDDATDTLGPTGLWHADGPDRFAEMRAATEHTSFPRGDGLPGRVLASGQPAWIADVHADPDFPRAAAARASGIRSAFAFPVSTASGVVAVLEFFSTEPTEPDEPLLRMMETIGASVGRVFERMRAQEEVAESGARFRALAHNATDAIVTIDQDDRILYANPATARLFGYAVEELTAMHFSALMPERYRGRHRAGLQRFVRTHERNIPWDGVELPGLHRDGAELPLEITFGVFERDGRHFFTGIMRDVSERRRVQEEREQLLEREREARALAEEARHEAERRARQERALREAAAAVAAAFTVEETAQRIASSALEATNADGAYVQRVDAESGELEVIAVAGDLVPRVGSRAPFADSLTERIIEQEEPVLIPRLDESEQPLAHALPPGCETCSVAVIPLLDAGQPVGSLTLLRHVSHATFGVEELARALTFGELAALAFRKIHLLADSERRREELERVMESRTRLIRGFSHDVKNPIGAADGFLQLLEEGVYDGDPEKRQDAVVRARRALGSALTLIDDLLELARAEAGQLELRIAATDVREATEDIAGEYRAQAERAGLTLSVDVPDDFPVIESDPARVRQIVGNIVSNAVKYTPPPGRIDVRVFQSDRGPGSTNHGWAAVEVEDTGPGIPAGKREFLFEEFSRLNPDGPHGAGIGLAISRRLARALGGDLTLRSEEGSGSTFTLWLPRTPPGAGQA